MATEAMSAGALVAELAEEAATTRRVLERIPEEKLSWRPHQKSMSLGELAFHVAVLPFGIAELLSELVREVPDVPRPGGHVNRRAHHHAGEQHRRRDGQDLGVG